MQYHIASKNVEMTQHLYDDLLFHVEKLEPLVQHFPPDGVHVNITVERHQRTQDYIVSMRLGLADAVVLVSKEMAPGLDVAARLAVEDIIDQLGRYKAQLSGQPDYDQAASDLHPQTMTAAGRALVDERELLDRSLAGDEAAFTDLTRRHLPAVTRTVRRALREQNITDRAQQDERLRHILAQTMALAFRDLPRKPAHMSLQGWLNFKAQAILGEEAQSQEPGLGGVA
ncbi:MAG: HPF/RaiA family ribosome-associated protein [Chloroflexi bacterium]|nr:HPF/RaiA family ribosome-associated protein [Chloroflexota bacterium]